MQHHGFYSSFPPISHVITTTTEPYSPQSLEGYGWGKIGNIPNLWHYAQSGFSQSGFSQSAENLTFDNKCTKWLLIETTEIVTPYTVTFAAKSCPQIKVKDIEGRPNFSCYKQKKTVGEIYIHFYKD
ncbi:hypothetical protein KSP40_PGU011574 [Platanthera guangdongensis]|uniref:Uncharacterized protein n=1 Tax=Platanthera guangdongensis TaxID=2320717 RepID=A0ABR2MTF8_9ASPA